MGPQAGFRAIAADKRHGPESILVTQDSSVVIQVAATSRVQAQFVELFDLGFDRDIQGTSGYSFGKSATGG